LVADAADGADEWALVAGVDLAAEIVDVDVDNIGHGVKVQAPDLFNDGSARDGLAGVTHEKFEQGKFLGAQLDGTTAALHGVGDAIELEIFDAEKDTDGAVPEAYSQPSPHAHCRPNLLVT